MQDMNSEARYSDFEQAIIEAAEREAAALITGAQREKLMMVRAAKNSVAQSEYIKLSEAAEHWRFGAKATEEQNGRRRLLLYRAQLCAQLMQKVKDRLVDFVNSSAYEQSLADKRAAHKALFSAQSVTVYCRAQDEKAVNALLIAYENAVCVPAADIAIGGVRLAAGRLLYDETMDAAIVAEDEHFLTYCGLKVV